MIHPCCLTIAGSDSGGNAGVQADLRAFHAYGRHGCTVFTALTAQNPFGVSAIHPIPATMVAAQLDAVLGAYDIHALKTGMLATPETIECIAEKLHVFPQIAKVIDPVMIATSGARLMTEDAIRILRIALLPLATVITPNIPEAEVLSKRSISDVASAHIAAQSLHAQYGCAVIIKGGHFEDKMATDVLYDGSHFEVFTAPRLMHPISTHGTGCTFAAALTAELSFGRTLKAAIAGAKQHVSTAIEKSFFVGANCGVLGFCN